MQKQLSSSLLQILCLMFMALGLKAQTPQAFNYQAVVRSKLGKIMPDKTVNFRISILQDSINGTSRYSEMHNTRTNAHGLANLQIGKGAVLSGNFSTINWGGSTHFIKVELDANAGSNYEHIGTTQLLSVPYALYAEKAGNVDDADADPTNELQTISKVGATVTLSNGGGSFNDDVNDADADPTNELQTISKVGSTVTLSNGGGSFTDEVNDADASPTNELQTLSILGNQLTISSGNTVTLPTGGGGGGTLDNAYDFGGAGAGRLITADAGEVDISTNVSSGIALRATNSNTGVAIIASSTNSGNTFSTIQASTSSSSNIASAIIGNSSGAAWGISGQVQAGSTAQSAVYGSNLRSNGGHGLMGIGYNGTVGQTNYSQGYGIYGENFDAIAPLGNGVGVAGKGYYGVLGEDRYVGGVAGAYGVYCNGAFAATGTKSFNIDHPQDPDNKFLRHFSMESPEVLNVYRGTTAFDVNGEAIVELPSYFDAINRNVSYQLTPVGGYAPLYVKQKVEGNRFVVGGGQAGLEVSWAVYAERNDAFLQANPEQRSTELEKRPEQKGKYLMPSVYGKDAQQGIFGNTPTKIEQKELSIKD